MIEKFVKLQFLMHLIKYWKPEKEQDIGELKSRSGNFEYFTQLFSVLRTSILDVVVHSCNPIIQEAEARKSRIPSQPELSRDPAET